eukprot:3969959-Lingulodinium_polyedra.AAC.1
MCCSPPPDRCSLLAACPWLAAGRPLFASRCSRFPVRKTRFAVPCTCRRRPIACRPPFCVLRRVLVAGD